MPGNVKRGDGQAAKPVPSAYAAGLLDSAGTLAIIGTVKRRWSERYQTTDEYVYWRLECDICLIVPDSLIRLREQYGGKFHTADRRKKRRHLTKWLLVNEECRPFLAAVKPYVVGCRPQVGVALRFLDARLEKAPTDPVFETLRAMMHALNHGERQTLFADHDC